MKSETDEMLKDGERLVVSMSFMDAEQQAVANDADEKRRRAYADYQARISDRWRNPQPDVSHEVAAAVANAQATSATAALDAARQRHDERLRNRWKGAAA
jgi:hypothetical protein